MTPEMGITYYQGTDNYYPLGLAFSKEQASSLFYDNQNLGLVLCICVPRAAYCSCVADAVAFFDEGEPKKP